MAANGSVPIQNNIFEDLQRKIDEDTAVKDVSNAQYFYSATSDDVNRHCAISSNHSRNKASRSLR